MATIENLVKTKKRKELSNDQLKEFKNKHDKNVQSAETVKTIFDTIGDVLHKESFILNGDDSDKQNALNAIANLQETIYDNISKKYNNNINDFNSYIRTLKKDTYNIPEYSNDV